MRRADRETHGEHRSFSEDAGDVDGAAVDGDQLADQGQADAGTLVGARRRPFDAVKSIEDVVEIVRRDADPGVSHAELDVSVGRRHRHPDRALERELERVRQQIEDDLFPHLAVDVDRARQRRTVDHQLQPCPFGGRSERAGEIGGQRRQIRRFERGGHASGFDARKVQQGVHELEQPQLVAMNRFQFLPAQRFLRRPERVLRRDQSST